MAVDIARLEEIFIAASQELDAAARAEFLASSCAGDVELRRRVDQLLSTQEKLGDFLDLPNVTDILDAMPERIGRYKLLEQIGEGGFGVVYMAEQEEPVRRRVALKIIKLGMDTRHVVARFEAERQALAMMDHSNVAKVFDGGATQTGRPYFVMELVKGIPITQYCDKKCLALEQRLKLFVSVCQAVQHAHQKGIIHRDLKPTNVLVAEYDDQPVPKVIDFGVAKATDHKLTDRTMFTEYGQVIGTVEYMSPEQAKFNQLDVDTRSDIYSLGVLLYELLAGTTPLAHERCRNAALDEVLRVIREEDPPTPTGRLSQSASLPSIAAARQTTPAKLSSEIRGELDSIVMHALEKDRNRRYQTANALADDINRYLQGEPIQASSPSIKYRIVKYIRKNRVVVSFAILLMAGVVILSLSNQRIKSERDAKTAALARATAETQKAREVADYFSELLGQANPYQSNGAEYTVRQLLDDSSDRLELRFASQPVIEAEIRATIGEAYRNLDYFKDAEPHLRRTLELRRQTVGDRDPLYADALIAWAWLLAVNGELEDATRRVEEALTIYRSKASHPGRRLEALRLYQWIDTSRPGVLDEATQVAEQLPSGEHPALASILHVHGEYLAQAGQAADGEEYARRAIAMHRRLRREGHPETSFAIWTLGKTLEAQQKLTEAEAAFREALTLFRKEYGPRLNARGPQVAFESLVRVLRAQGKHPAADALTRERNLLATQPGNER